MRHSIIHIVEVNYYGDDDAADGVRKSYGRHKMYIDTATYGCTRQYVTGRYLNAIIYKYNTMVDIIAVVVPVYPLHLAGASLALSHSLARALTLFTVHPTTIITPTLLAFRALSVKTGAL